MTTSQGGQCWCHLKCLIHKIADGHTDRLKNISSHLNVFQCDTILHFHTPYVNVAWFQEKATERVTTSETRPSVRFQPVTQPITKAISNPMHSFDDYTHWLDRADCLPQVVNTELPKKYPRQKSMTNLLGDLLSSSAQFWMFTIYWQGKKFL